MTQTHTHSGYLAAITVAVGASTLLGLLKSPSCSLAGNTSSAERSPSGESARVEQNILPSSCSLDLKSGLAVGKSATVQALPDSPTPPFLLTALKSGASPAEADLVWHCFSHEFERDGEQVSVEIRGIELRPGVKWAVPLDGCTPASIAEAKSLDFYEGEIPFDVGATDQFGGRTYHPREVSGLSFADRLQQDLYPLSLVPQSGTLVIRTADGEFYQVKLGVLPQHDPRELRAGDRNTPGYYLTLDSMKLNN